MTCHDCLAELVNRHVALYGATKHGELNRIYAEWDRMKGVFMMRYNPRCMKCLTGFYAPMQEAYKQWLADDRDTALMWIEIAGNDLARIVEGAA